MHMLNMYKQSQTFGLLKTMQGIQLSWTFSFLGKERPTLLPEIMHGALSNDLPYKAGLSEEWETGKGTYTFTLHNLIFLDFCFLPRIYNRKFLKIYIKKEEHNILEQIIQFYIALFLPHDSSIWIP